MSSVRLLTRSLERVLVLSLALDAMLRLSGLLRRDHIRRSRMLTHEHLADVLVHSHLDGVDPSEWKLEDVCDPKLRQAFSYSHH